MTESDTLSPNDLRQINALAISFPITGVQPIYLYRFAGKDRALVEAALMRAESAGEDVYTGALRRLSEEK